MYMNCHKIYIRNRYECFYRYIVRVLVFDKDYFYNIYIEMKNNIFMFLPQCKYKNNKECKL